ncbi:DUF2333 family protein [Wenzhouxiangella marina]|uniref:Uncharacterized protein n=1 Tax=Wenzhouxiangella marina TaxID=1579979 RepID=A0A0K0XU44_9GAMM|nr:DUF2333 family protein [Wenzhouxiangella marina]AKS41190.1 hypothetical protein WM2015_809 [Wenzhouxiangella marina]MBB6088069.1 hypothetical protein [Wenzhouxiangella marina]
MAWIHRLIGTGWRRIITLSVLALIIASAVVMFYVDHEPERFDVVAAAQARADAHGHELRTGYVTTATLIEVMDILLDKRGGYLQNDVMPPWVLLDNIPSWEIGVVFQARDLARSLRNDFSRSQTQSAEDADLALADPQFSFDYGSWLLPSTEGEYQEGIDALERYLERLGNEDPTDARFFDRADNLREYLALVEKRLGDIGQQLSASVGERRLNTDLAGDPIAHPSGNLGPEVRVKTPWLEIDDVFYQARGTTWALIHFLRAIEHDFAAVLENKNASPSLAQIIRELEASQRPIWSPMILNGGGFGFTANHSLVMANYIARANAAVIDLRRLLEQG